MTRTICMSVALLLILSSIMNSAESRKTIPSPLIVFHFDFNSVALNESYIRKWLLRASEMGYNAVLWEVEGKVQWETCPECVSPDAFSKERFKEILNYSRALGLEPIPLLQTVGHAEYVLQHETYFSFKEDPAKYDCYATCNPELRQFIRRWIKEYLDLFGGVRFFHLGGDEAYEFATSTSCKAEVQEKGKGKLFADYMCEIAQLLREKGIRPCIWNDQIMKYPDAISSIPGSFVIWDWNYWEGDYPPQKVMVWDKGKKLSRNELTPEVVAHFPEILDRSGNLRSFYTSNALTRLGYDVVLCSSSRSSGDGVFSVRQRLHASNIVGAARKTVEEGLLGTCVTSWAVRIPSYEMQQTLLYLAPLTIRYNKLTLDELQHRSFEYTFGVPGDDIIEATEKIGSPLPFADQQSTGIMWTGMKDSRPAPPGYIHRVISEWAGMDGGEQWIANRARIKASTGIVSRGINELNEFVPRAVRGFDVLEDWQKAGYFQYWGSVIANDIAARVAGDTLREKGDIVLLLTDLKRDHEHWLRGWMTPASAEINSGLVYDALLDYFVNRKP